jgi:hypothetical protein
VNQRVLMMVIVVLFLVLAVLAGVGVAALLTAEPALTDVAEVRP